MPWDEEAFQNRIMMRATALGLSERDVMRKAGISEGTFNKPPRSQGRTYNTIELIANAVGLTVGEAIGANGRLPLKLVETAVAVAVRAINSDRAELLAAAIVSVFDVLSERDREGEPIDETVLSALEQMLRRQSR